MTLTESPVLRKEKEIRAGWISFPGSMGSEEYEATVLKDTVVFTR
jgi:hypothetical protein